MNSLLEELHELFTKTFGNRRLFIIIGGLSGAFAVLSFFSESFLFYFSNFISLDLRETSIPIALLLISVASFSLIYLQSGANGVQENYNKVTEERLQKEIEAYKKKQQLRFLSLRIG